MDRSDVSTRTGAGAAPRGRGQACCRARQSARGARRRSRLALRLVGPERGYAQRANDGAPGRTPVRRHAPAIGVNHDPIEATQINDQVIADGLPMQTLAASTHRHAPSSPAREHASCPRATAVPCSRSARDSRCDCATRCTREQARARARRCDLLGSARSGRRHDGEAIALRTRCSPFENLSRRRATPQPPRVERPNTQPSSSASDG